MTDIEKYKPFLEGVCKGIVDMKPACIAVATLNPDGTTAAFYFNCEAPDKAFLAAAIQQDGLMDRIGNNPDWLREVLERDQPEGHGRFEE